MNPAALGDFVMAVSSFHDSRRIYADYMRIYAHIRCIQPLLGPAARSSMSSAFTASNTSSISMEITYSTHSAPASTSEVPNRFADSITFKRHAYCALGTACESSMTILSTYCHSSGALRWVLILNRSFMDAINDGDVFTHAKEFPSFLYDLNQDYNPDRPLIGLFRGPLLVRVTIRLLLRCASCSRCLRFTGI